MGGSAAKKLKGGLVSSKREGDSSSSPFREHNPFWSSSLFNEVYLRNDVPVKYAKTWESDPGFERFQNDFHNFVLEQEVENAKTWSESDTIDNWIVPIMEMLGWHDNCESRQTPYVKELSFTVSENGKKKSYRLDLAYVDKPSFKQYTTNSKSSDEKLREARNLDTGVLMVVEAKYWDRLEQYRQRQKEDRKRADVAKSDGEHSLSPDDQILRYLDIIQRDFGVLTDGKTWRLYHRGMSTGDVRRYFEFDVGNLADLVRSDLSSQERRSIYLDQAKYFYYIFRKSSHVQTGTEPPFVQQILDYSRKYVNTVEQDLKRRFIQAMGVICNSFKNSIKKTNQKDNLELIRNAAESHLFNILFIRSCETRRILPIHAPAYLRCSLSEIIETLDHMRFDPDKDISVFNRYLTEAFGPQFKLENFDIYERLMNLYQIVQSGSVGFAVEGFKETLFEIEEVKFSEKHKIDNGSMLRVLFCLNFTESESEQRARKYQQIPYNIFTPRQLGSIYESFLEFKLEEAKTYMVFHKQKWQPAAQGSPQSLKLVEKSAPEVHKGELYFTPNNEERKITGSYYTPDCVVRHIVKKSLGPLVENKSSSQILEINICDLAMGSGHFLSGALQYLTNAYREKLVDETISDIDETFEETARKVLASSIFGVDSNARAVKLAKMSLWLATAVAGKQLECLSDQLECFDSLCRRDDWVDKFPKVFKRGGFDGIIGNPPYVALDDLGDEVRNKLQNLDPEIFSSSNDVYYHFYSAGIRLLRDGGILGFITARYFLEATHAKGLRAVMSKKLELNYLVDFQNVDPFAVRVKGEDGKLIQVQKGVGSKTMILIGKRTLPKSNNFNVCRIVSRYWEAETEAIFGCIENLMIASTKSRGGYVRENGIEYYAIAAPQLGSEKWDLSPNEHRKMMNKLSAEGRTLGSFKSDGWIVGQGMVTGKDSAFTISSTEAENLKLSNTELKPLIKNGGIRRYRIVESGSYWVTPHRFVKSDRRALKLLEGRKKDLLSRGDFKRGRAKYNWYEYSRVQNPSLFEMKEKIVTPYKSARNNFALDLSGAIFSADVYGIGPSSGVDTFALLAFLNSSPVEFAIKYHAKRIDYRYEYYEEALCLIPIPNALCSQFTKKVSLPTKAVALEKINKLSKKSYDKIDVKSAHEVLALAGFLASKSNDSDCYRSIVDKCVGKLFGLDLLEAEWFTDYISKEWRDNESQRKKADTDAESEEEAA